MTKTDVLIVGAGPTGLMMACQLAMRNISFRIIDKTEDHTTQSRALVIHARSMEILQQMGIADQAIEKGKIARAGNLFVNGKITLSIPLKDIGKNLTDFPFILILEQSKTEALLIDFLKKFNVQVERRKELIDFSQNANTVTATIQNKTGDQETFEINWLVGADGAHSKVRENLQIPFLGKIYPQLLFVLDCKMNFHFPANEMYISFSKETFSVIFPLPGERTRVIGFLEKEFENKAEITFDDVNRNFARRTRLNVTLSEPQWIAKYHTHHRVVSAFRKGRCFVAGDAAHIHSPVGGQGMNTGLQDAYNLAWKLAMVIQNKAKESLLDTYQQERIKIAKRLVNSTDRVFNYITSKNKFIKFYLLYVIPVFLKVFKLLINNIYFIMRIAFENISEIGLNYRASKLSVENNPSSFRNSSVKPGDRVPYNTLRKTFTKGITFHLLLFSKEKSPENILAEFMSVCASYPGLITISEIPFTSDTKNIYRQFGIHSTGFYLIRPDSYIAYRCEKLDANTLKYYLNEVVCIL